MDNPEHFKILKSGVESWNEWRKENRNIIPDLSNADLSETDLSKANLSEAKLEKANLSIANLSGANLSEAKLNNSVLFGADLSDVDFYRANLSGANLFRANLSNANLINAKLIGANLNEAILEKANLWNANLSDVNLSEAKLNNSFLTGADLRNADLSRANLSQASLIQTDLTNAKLIGADLVMSDLIEADLSGANLSGACLDGARLIRTQLNKADFTGCSVYGISAWELKSEDSIQEDLIITLPSEPVITVDSLEVAQFLHLLLNNEKIRNVIDTITSKVVLILGNFKKPRKAVLDVIRIELRKRDYLPILFDFDKPGNRDLTETISTLAHMARFIIADITEPKCVPHELATIIPTLSVPVKPLLLKGSSGEYAMFRDLKQKYHWVLEVYRYEDQMDLIESLERKVIGQAEKKAKALIKHKNR